MNKETQPITNKLIYYFFSWSLILRKFLISESDFHAVDLEKWIWIS